MNSASFLGLIQNAALLLAVAFLFDVAAIRWRTTQSSFLQVPVGLALGIIGIAVMMTPWTFAPGIVFDTRSVLLGISGLFFGGIATSIAMAMTAAVRFYQGGAGAWTGMAVILISGTIGIVWRRFRRQPVTEISGWELYLFGVTIHVAMLATMLTLPRGTSLQVLSNITLPVLAIYPLGTAMLGVLMVNRLRRERTEDALRESEEKYRNLFENANEAIYVIQDGKLLFLNPMCAVMTGYSDGELMTRPFAEFIHPDDRDLVVDRHFRRMKHEALPHIYSFRMIHNNGSVKWVELNAILINWKGKPATLSFLSDITERKRTEDALRESEANLREAQEIARMGRWDLDMATGRLMWSDGIYALFEVSRENFSASYEAFLDFVHPEDRALVDQAYRDSVENKINYEIEHRLLMKDGRIKRVSEMGRTEYDETGKPVRSVGTVQDITERRRAEEENRALAERLQRAEKMEALGQLAGGVAHDLNNVLGILSGYSELLLEQIPEGHRSRGYVEKILQSTEKGAAIIQDLLTLARRSVPVSDVVNLNRVVSDFVKSLVFERMKDSCPSVTFKAEYDKNLLNIKGSPVHLEKTVMNLVSNAAESISGPGEVTIRTESRYLDKAIRGYDEVREGDYAVLVVSDTGMGIPDDSREKIFEPFYTKKMMGRSGTGLGLAIVWGTVKDLNGYIDVQTELGKGSTFSLYFPVTREELVEQQQKERMERYMGKGESVLVIDDVAEQRDIAAGLLARLGYEAHTVSSGEEAVEYLRENQTDILVLDMIMPPGIDGLETYQRILTIHPKQKAILVSGFSETEQVREAQRLGAGVYVRKPYLMEKIGMAVRDELDR